VLRFLTKTFPWAASILFKRICRCCIPFDEFFHQHAVPAIAQILAFLAPEVVKTASSAVVFFTEIILPLHKCDQYPAYHTTLGELVFLVVTLENSLLPEFVNFMASHWPVRSRAKSSMVFDELSLICEAFARDFDEVCARKLVRKIASFFADMAGDLSQQAFFLLGSDSLRPIVHKCEPGMKAFLYQKALMVNSTHWIAETRHFASDFLIDLAAGDPSVKRGLRLGDPAETHEAQRRDMWEQFVGHSSQHAGYPLVRSASY
jgi:hypothetical protein